MRKILVFILLSLTLAASAQQTQKIKELEDQRKKMLAEIEVSNQLLEKIEKTKITALNVLSLLNQQIKDRRTAIHLLNQEIELTNDGIRMMEADIRGSERELKAKKDMYAESIRRMYLNQSNQNKLLFIFSADNFTQSYRRIRYLKEFAKWERRQAEDIMAKQKKLQVEKEKMEQVKLQKLALLESKQNEEEKLVGQEGTQKKEVQSLQKQQKQVVKELAQKKKQAQNLNAMIEKAIAEEIARAEREARAAAEAKALAEKNKAIAEQKAKTGKSKDKPVVAPTPVEEIEETRVAETKGGYAMTKEERSLSGDFSNNKGLLPYPLKGNYKVVSNFGQQQHPDLKYVVTNNNGVDIQTTPGNEARSVFNGVVTKIFPLAGYNNNVIVRHGNYLTVYSNIDDLYVKLGDKVSTGQVLGKIFTDKENGNSTILHFELWKERVKLNPESWLRR